MSPKRRDDGLRNPQVRTVDDFERWLHGTMLKALELQKPAAKQSLAMVPEKKKAARSSSGISGD